jgi:5'-nucleotidase
MDQVRIALDGDAVLFDEESERTYQEEGLAAFHAQERAAEDVPLPEGPYAGFLRKLAALKARLPMGTEYAPVRIAVVTARNAPADLRVVKTLRQWGVYVDAAFFLGGVSKADVLRAFNPHIFFDDQDVHLERARELVPAAKVPGRVRREVQARPEPAVSPM